MHPLTDAPKTTASAETAGSITSPTLSGTVEDLGRLVARPARNKLIRDRRIIAFLVSEQYDLNRFLHRPVLIWGETISSSDRRVPLIRVDRVEPMRQPQ